MTDTDISLPPEWTEKRDKGQHGTAVIEYQHETADDTIFIISILPKIADEGFKLRLSAIERTSAPIRHDYPVQEYDTFGDAVKGAESFIEIFSNQIQEGSILSADLQTEAIHEIIKTFRGEQTFSSIRCLLRRLL